MVYSQIKDKHQCYTSTIKDNALSLLGRNPHKINKRKPSHSMTPTVLPSTTNKNRNLKGMKHVGMVLFALITAYCTLLWNEKHWNGDRFEMAF